jgi:5,10-methylenetetrahydromethanopterin reductase
VSLRLGLGIAQEYTAAELIELGQRCEALGYEHLWYSGEKLYRDSWVGLTLLAASTRRVKVGTFIVDPYTQHPALAAAAIATLDEASNGRAMLLIGAGGAGTSSLGIPRVKPARAIGEAVRLSRQLLRGDGSPFEGEVVHFGGGELHFPARPDLPIYVASRGNLVLSIAGEHADGVMIATFATPRGVEHGMERVARGAARAGRTLQQHELFVRVDTCLADDARLARAAVRPSVAMRLGSSYPDRSFIHALGLQVPEAFESIARQRNRELNARSADLVPDDIVDAMTWSGNPGQVAESVAAIVEVGIRNITFMPVAAPGQSTWETIRLMAEQVMPRVEALTQG